MEGEGKESREDLSWLPEGKGPIADGNYDAIILGTGLTECIVSGLLSVNGMKVLHIDRNNYYGGASASLNLTNLFKKFRGEDSAPPAILGANRDYNVDLVPKFIMACGDLVKILLHTKVTRYLEFKSIDGSFVQKDGRIYKVPATPDEAIKTSLMGIFEKRRFRNLLVFVNQYDEQNEAATSQGMNLRTMTMKQLYDHFGVDANTMAFTGHAMALYSSDAYLQQPAINCVKALKLYVYSLEQHGRSPYIYPIYGLGGLPEGFSRLCAINGGTFMLNCEFSEVLYENGVAWGIRAGNEIARAPLIIGDPSYFGPEKLRSTGRVVRSICLLNHPIPNTEDRESSQIIIPSAQTGRVNDIYIASVSYAHSVAARGMWVAIVSTQVETANPLQEVAAGIALLGPVLERFDDVCETFTPASNGIADHCFVSKSYDAASHFESAAQDVLDIYKRVTGRDLDLSISADLDEEQ